MRPEFFRRAGRWIAVAALSSTALTGARAEPQHGIAMYGAPELPPDFVSLPYANPDAPKGGSISWGETTGFDSLHPFILKGRAPWPQRFLMYESLLGRSRDEAFTLYALLAESVEMAEDRSWVEFTLRPEARFSDGGPVTVEDVIWSFETLGTRGDGSYRNFWTAVAGIEETAPGTVRVTFSDDNPELPLLAGLRPILKKGWFETRDFEESTLDAPVGSGPYLIGGVDAGRSVTFARDPDYWGADLPFRRGTMNFDEVTVEYFGDGQVLFEAFKAGELDVLRVDNAEDWETRFDFPGVASGEIVKSVIPHGRPSGITGLVMNTRRPQFDTWQEREALIAAFNFEYINDTLTGGRQPRITSYFSNSELGMQPGPATGRVLEYLEPYADSLPPGAIEGYALPVSDGSERNRANLRDAARLLAEAGWQIGADGLLRDAEGNPFTIDFLLRQADRETAAMVDIYARALERLGITVVRNSVDDAQWTQRTDGFDFDMTWMRRAVSLSPGNEQKFYWGSEAAETEGSRNWMGIRSEAVDGLIEEMLRATSREDFVAATRALDRVLTAGRYAVPFYEWNVSRIAHGKEFKFSERLPLYGDWSTRFMPEVWWYEAD